MIHTFGFVVLALVDVVIAGKPGALLYAVGLAAGCGLVLDGLVLVSKRYWPLSYGAACALAALFSLPYALERRAHYSFSGVWARVIFILFVGAFAVGFPLLYAGARWLGRRNAGRLVLLLAAAGVAVANQRMYRGNYLGNHAFINWAAALLVGAVFPWRIPPRLVAAVAAVAVLAFAIPPSNQMRQALFASSSAIAPWVAAALRWKLPEPTVPPVEWASKGAASSPSLVDGAPVVILFVVDGLRWNQLEGPNFRRLAQRGVTFGNAHSPGSQTATTMATVFSGRYPSQLDWSFFGEGRLYGTFPVADPAPRVPSLLTRAGVRTVKLGGIGLLGNAYGVAPGFSEELLIPKDDHGGSGAELVKALLPLLDHSGPLLVYAHFMDLHAPYRGPAGCAPFDCYRSQVAVVDGYLGQILDVLDQPPLAQRALLLFTADHGEAFGEHGSGGHSTTIYEELIRVPLIAYGASLQPRVVTEPVTLVDLGPTLLDLFAQPTPPGFMGESLVPTLRGGGAAFSRPIFAEGRLRRAILDKNRKLIVDLRRKTVEAYDLSADSSELDDRWDDARFAPLYSTLMHFFAANAAAYRP